MIIKNILVSKKIEILGIKNVVKPLIELLNVSYVTPFRFPRLCYNMNHYSGIISKRSLILSTLKRG